ncbi:hypothetical protein [Nostoc sp. 'Lobaria pulmonaria (5183) cyanobiont']|uniref:hypothetical protein n=1 Tax=Nostoc sp. 'Lobaria pulmonaria (5183) cyanobiont' TaxID=1618022 RepID=UPI000CF35C2A|nr:hypothetical protein [Nostoc sp. 'Lobaria pulmonaria (5183) cyanobiont']AVH72353.1 hypothetical protein NLP_3843 [Nostoc sp. 'Lobaria pulmonaria (5183) cyanobiont']
MLNLIFTKCIKIKPLVVSTAFLIAVQTSANAQQAVPSLTPAQAQHLSRDLVPYNSQDFFRQGKDSIAREIQILNQRQQRPIKPILEIDLVQQSKKPHTQQKSQRFI